MKYLGTMTYRQVEQYREKTNIALLPVGATEAHGPHLPLMVDSVSAEEIVKRAAEKLQRNNIDVLIAPTIHYAVAETSHSFAITLSFATLAGLIEDICNSLCKWGFNRIMIISGHGEQKNRQAIAEGLQRAQAKNEYLKAAISKWFAKGCLPCAISPDEHPQGLSCREWNGPDPAAASGICGPGSAAKARARPGGQFLRKAAAGKKDWLGAQRRWLISATRGKRGKKRQRRISDLFAEIVAYARSWRWLKRINEGGCS